MCVLCISKSMVEKYYTTDSDYYLGKYLWVDWKIFEYVWTVTGWLELVSSVRVTAGDQHRWLTSQHSFASIIIDLTPVTSDRKYLMWVCVRCGSVSSLGLHWWSPIKSVSVVLEQHVVSNVLSTRIWAASSSHRSRSQYDQYPLGAASLSPEHWPLTPTTILNTPLPDQTIMTWAPHERRMLEMFSELWTYLRECGFSANWLDEFAF